MNMSMAPNTFLLVEDSNADAVLLRRAFSKAHIVNPVRVTVTGEEALAYLSGSGKYSDRRLFPIPSVILLDLNLPGISGFEVLAWVRQQPHLSHVRIVILTDSDDSHQVKQAYQLGAASYLVKPNDLDELASFAQALGGFWQWEAATPEAPPQPEPVYSA